jgi:ClpP class serine protease
VAARVLGRKGQASVGLIRKVTRERIRKVQAIVANTHQAFKKHVAEARPLQVDRIEERATGDMWPVYGAVDSGLMDQLVPSDERLKERLVGKAKVL